MDSLPPGHSNLHLDSRNTHITIVDRLQKCGSMHSFPQLGSCLTDRRQLQIFCRLLCKWMANTEEILLWLSSFLPKSKHSKFHKSIHFFRLRSVKPFPIFEPAFIRSQSVTGSPPVWFQCDTRRLSLAGFLIRILHLAMVPQVPFATRRSQ
jgi:hypothetical protein